MPPTDQFSIAVDNSKLPLDEPLSVEQRLQFRAADLAEA
jgi:hypothetical protein